MSLFGSGSFCACTESGVGNPLVRHGTSKSGLHTSSFFATYPSRWAGWAGCGGWEPSKFVRGHGGVGNLQGWSGHLKKGNLFFLRMGTIFKTQIANFLPETQLFKRLDTVSWNLLGPGAYLLPERAPVQTPAPTLYQIPKNSKITDKNKATNQSNITTS